MQWAENYKRVVIKIGASLFYSNKNKLDVSLVKAAAGQIKTLFDEGREVVVVSSGAIALGMSILKLAHRPTELSRLQAVAAIGQHELMDIYRRFFKERGLTCAQLLLTWDDFSQRARFHNAKNTLDTLLKLKSVPVINENDTVATEEIKFGDNDRLCALVSILVEADLLIILSDVEGLQDKNKKVIRLVPKITAKIKKLACPTNKKTSVGGMITKIEACAAASRSGIPCVIASGKKKNIITQIMGNTASSGSLFLPEAVCLDAQMRHRYVKGLK